MGTKIQEQNIAAGRECVDCGNNWSLEFVQCPEGVVCLSCEDARLDKKAAFKIFVQTGRSATAEEIDALILKWIEES